MYGENLLFGPSAAGIWRIGPPPPCTVLTLINGEPHVADYLGDSWFIEGTLYYEEDIEIWAFINVDSGRRFLNDWSDKRKDRQ